jgi:DNA-binding LytR/AlgR family response regulator
METSKKYITITQGYKKHRLAVSDILHIEAIRVYSVLHVKKVQSKICQQKLTVQYVSSTHLGKLVAQLDEAMFLRVHKSHVVNVYEIKSLNKGKSKVQLSDNTEVALAQRRKSQVVNQLRIINGKNPKHPQKGLRINP